MHIPCLIFVVAVCPRMGQRSASGRADAALWCSLIYFCAAKTGKSLYAPRLEQRIFLRIPMPITPQQALQRTIEHREIFHDEMLHLMRLIMRGELSPVMTAAIVTGLRVKKETIGEIAAAAQVMREFSHKVQVADSTHLVDIVGTGGDGANTFNISTCATFVIAAAGGKVSKHGGRGVSSKSGSADAMEALGVHINLTAEQIAQCIAEVGVGFMFAPNHHPAMKNVAPVRKELGVRTIFNILGPLTNPASAPNILMGVFHEDLVGIQIRALQRLGAEHALVIYGRDGLDEISLGASTLVGELKNGQITEYEIHPEDFGLPMVGTRQLRVETPEQSRAIVLEVLAGKAGPARDIVCLNAGAALYAANVADSITTGLALAQQAIDSGAAQAKLEALVAYTQKVAA
ncbi:anthranilate phosphoribosyltransferase [Giesbergeria anulus]|uniref:Anthranilate phosphoribosyltransferase n=2 Tax=Giesbergeria anulus TaxID=180197 RepID=A0A1H9LKL8_9BURK|nr:anthranilate phosphoribosyltransferase [Giesbergeria anulus]